LTDTPPQTFEFDKGLGQKFGDGNVILDLGKYEEHKVPLKNKHNFLVVLHLVNFTQITLTNIGLEGASTSLCIKRDRPKENEDFAWRVVAHRYHMSGVSWNLYEIFGLPKKDTSEDENSCIVCMSERKSSAVIPCGHVCLCQSCGETLQKQPNAKCPLCRTGVQSLVNIQQCPV
jgi:hypothetical protein